MSEQMKTGEIQSDLAIHYELASLGSRFLAKLVDSLLIILVGLLAVVLGGGLDEKGNYMIPFFGIGLLVLLILQGFLLTKNGYTVGKKLMKIKILKFEDNFDGGFVRNFLVRSVLNYVLAIFPLYSLVDTLFIFSNDYRCLHDRLAGTKVVSTSEIGDVYKRNIIDEAWDTY